MNKVLVVFVMAWCIAFAVVVPAQQSSDGPRYTNGNNLVRPTDYREWMFLSSGLGMTYRSALESQSAEPKAPQFSNIFVNPSSYRSFMQTGKWPDGTTFILEARNSDSEASINKGGRFQTGFARLEAEVKDSRFPDGWAFYNFGPGDSAVPLSGQKVAPCVECHTKHTAVERTFVQFYPTLMEVARQKGTLNPGF